MAMIHVNRGATSLGAFPEEEVRDGLRTGRFVSSDIGWREGMASWQPLSQFPEIGATASGEPPPQIGATSVPETLASHSGLPWDERQTKGLFNAFIETLQMVLSRPVAAFTAMKREGGLGEPLLYATIGGTFGVVFAVIYNFVLRSFTSFGDRHDAFAHLLGGLGWIVILIVGGAKQTFETTFRVVCFAEGSASPLLVIPFCGGLIAGIWKIVLYCIGLARAHETDTGRAVLAVVLPVIVCCGGVLLIAMMFGALGAWSTSQH